MSSASSSVTRKALGAQIAPTARGFTAIVTAETLDRDGEVLIPQGCNATEFMTNPVLFWNHDYSKPIGKCVALRREANTIVGEFEFAQRPDGYEGEFFPEVAAALVAQGVVNAVSVGYVPEEGGVRMALPVDKKKYGDKVHTIYNRWKLLEISLAPLQANPEALITAVKKGLCSTKNAKALFGISVEESQPRQPLRVEITVPRKKIKVEIAVGSSRGADRPITMKTLVRQEIARARGKFWAD